MMRSLFSGVSGLSINVTQMDVIGNNVANANTIGYKASRVTFEETMSQLLKGAGAPEGNLGGSNPMQVGTGASLGTIDPMFTQGSLEQTGVDTDLAIQGNSFFVMSDGASQYYTRNGSFQLDGSGQLVNPANGFTLQGYTYDSASGTYSSLPGTLKLPLDEVEPAKATTEITYRGNLDADSQPEGTHAQSAIFYGATGLPAKATDTLDNLKADPAGVVDLLSPGDTISFSASVGGTPVSGSLAVGAGTTVNDLLNKIQTVLNGVQGISGITAQIDSSGRIQLQTPDSLGKTGEVTGLVIQGQDATQRPRDDFNGLAAMTQTQAARNASVFGEDTTVYDSLGFSHVVHLDLTRSLGVNQFTWKATVDDGSTPILSGGSGKVTFNSDGSINGFFYDAAGDTIPTNLSISPTTGAKTPLNISLAAGTAGTFTGMTLSSGPATLETTGDGFSKGTAVSFSIDQTGTVTSVFSNGVTHPIGKVALAQFVNPTGLVQNGDNLYQSSVNSGKPLVGMAGGAVQSTVYSGELEQSNVDLSREFTNMILAQRGFQASAKVITTSDAILNDLINLKQ